MTNSEIDKIFFDLTSENDEAVLNSLNELNTQDLNETVLAYLLNLSYFHRDSKVKRTSKKLFTSLAPDDLVEQSKSNWKANYLKHQEYYHKGIYEHPSIDSAEYLLFAQVIRKNFFQVKPKSGMAPYSSMRYGDEIENIFDCYQVQIEKIPSRIEHLQHITVANFRKQPKLKVVDTIEKLSKLNNLKFLQLADSELTELPIELSKLNKLEQLIIDMNPLTNIPPQIILPNLKKLDIKSTQIRSIDLSQFPNLDELWIDGEKVLKEMKFKNVNKPFIATSGKFFSKEIKI